jgi:hypothetical protein
MLDLLDGIGCRSDLDTEPHQVPEAPVINRIDRLTYHLGGHTCTLLKRCNNLTAPTVGKLSKPCCFLAGRSAFQSVIGTLHPKFPTHTCIHDPNPRPVPAHLFLTAFHYAPVACATLVKVHVNASVLNTAGEGVPICREFDNATDSPLTTTAEAGMTTQQQQRQQERRQQRQQGGRRQGNKRVASTTGKAERRIKSSASTVGGSDARIHHTPVTAAAADAAALFVSGRALASPGVARSPSMPCVHTHYVQVSCGGLVMYA